MTLTTEETLSVNGTILNTLAVNISSLTGRLKVPQLRTENITVPGRNGSLRTSSKLYSEGEVILPMWVRGVDEDGNVPSTRREQFYSNLDILTNLFRPGSGELLELIHTQPDGSKRRAWAECTEALDFSMTGRDLGKFSVALRLPSVFWEDVQPITNELLMPYTGPVIQLGGSTAPIEDAVFTVTGPVTNFRVEAYYNGAPLARPNYFQYSTAIAANRTFTVDCANWELSGTGGLGIAYTLFSQSGGARWLTLVPGPGGSPPEIKVTGSALTSASKLSVIARRKFLVG